MQRIRSGFLLGLCFLLAPALHAGEAVWDLMPNQKTGQCRRSITRASNEFLYLGQSVGTLPPLRLESEVRQPNYGMDRIDQDPLAGRACQTETPYDSFCETPVPLQSRDGWSGKSWSWQLLPDGVLYQNYLAGVNESRLCGVWNYDEDLHWIWDITLGGRAPLLRYGNRKGILPEGFQIDVEGSAHLRLDFENDMDMDATDFRAGLPLTYGNRIWQFKTGYYHVSSHLGDERILRLQAAGVPHRRINYVREAWIFGFSYRVRPSLRLYAEVDLAFSTGERTKPVHFQFGAEYASPMPTSGFRPAPFAAINILLLQEHDYDGSICVQAGWQWRGPRNQLFRFGFQYFGGVSEQYEHIIAKREHKFGIGLWYDF